MIEKYTMQSGVEVDVAFSSANNYMRISNVAKSSGKLATDWIRLKSTKAYIESLEASLCERYGNSHNDKIIGKMVIVKQGGRDQGTWIHPKLVIEFARWIEPEFAIWCNDIIERIISGETVSLSNTRALPKSFAESLRALADSEEEKERLAAINTHQAQVIEMQAPKVKYADAVKGSDGGVSIRDWVASLQSNDGLQVGEKMVFSFLDSNGYTYKCKRGRRPYASSKTAGLFVMVPGVNTSGKGSAEYMQLLITGKGQVELGVVVLDYFKGVDTISKEAVRAKARDRARSKRQSK